MRVYQPVLSVKLADFESTPPKTSQTRRSRSLWQRVQYAICILALISLAFFSVRCIHRAFVKQSDGRRSLWRDLFAPSSSFSTSNNDFTMSELLAELPVDHLAEFDDFIRDMKRQYSTEQERLRRFVIFAENQRRLAALQKRARNTIFGVTRFADLEDYELQQFLQPHSYQQPSIAQRNTIQMDTAPSRPPRRRPKSFDWRQHGAVVGVKDQGTCGSCWAFAVTAVVESLNIINGGGRLRLSEQQLIDCDKRNHACFGGYRPYAFEYVKRVGLLSDRNYSYVGQPSACRALNESRVKVDEIYGFDQDEEDIASWIATRGPVSIGVNVTREMFAYRGGVLNPSAEDCAYRSLGSHAMAIIGYGELNGESYWLLKNSWGPTYGLSGQVIVKSPADAA